MHLDHHSDFRMWRCIWWSFFVPCCFVLPTILPKDQKILSTFCLGVPHRGVIYTWNPKVPLLEAKQRTNGFQVRMYYILLDIYGNQFLLLHYDQHRQTLLSRCHGHRGYCSNCGSSTASTESCWSICRFGSVHQTAFSHMDLFDLVW